MDEYSYRFVPFIPTLKLGVFGPQNADAISDQLEQLVEQYARLGWEYVRLEQVSVVHTAGCLAAMFGKNSHEVDYDLVVFRMRREVLSGVSAEDAQSAGRPVPDAVKSSYAFTREQYRIWQDVRANEDTFTYTEDVESAREEFLDALAEMVELCEQEEPGVGVAVARKAQADFEEFMSDEAFVGYMVRLRARS